MEFDEIEKGIPDGKQSFSFGQFSGEIYFRENSIMPTRGKSRSYEMIAPDAPKAFFFHPTPIYPFFLFVNNPTSLYTVLKDPIEIRAIQWTGIGSRARKWDFSI